MVVSAWVGAVVSGVTPRLVLRGLRVSQPSASSASFAIHLRIHPKRERVEVPLEEVVVGEERQVELEEAERAVVQVGWVEVEETDVVRRLGVGEAVLVQAVALKVPLAEEAVRQVVVLVVGVVGLVEQGPQERRGCVPLGLRVSQPSSC